MVRSVDDKTSRYVHGGQSYIDSEHNMLTFWDRYNLPRSEETDIKLVITPELNHSPWLIASRLYGNASYLWVVLQYNNILDIEELEIGREIIVPSPVRLRTAIIIKNTGGTPDEN